MLLFLFKTEFIVKGTWQQLAKVNIASICVGGDANIAQVTSVKNHGSWFDHITPALILLPWLPACFTTKYKILILKAIYGVGVIKTEERTRHNLRSSKELLLEPPLVKTKKTLAD